MRLQVPFCQLAPLTLRQEQILTRGVHIACVPRNHNTSFLSRFPLLHFTSFSWSSTSWYVMQCSGRAAYVSMTRMLRPLYFLARTQADDIGEARPPLLHR
jgi:hypothetical protein